MSTETMRASKQSEPAATGDECDPFDIKQQLRNAPRPRPGHTSNIVEFYKGRSVLITGASGFIGKVLIEKLLRTCPSIERVFVLIRPKYNKKPRERLRELLDTPLFEGLRGEAESKVVVVEGDVTQANLGLSNYDLARVVREVSVIFHSAATVKFDEPLKQSVAINITGTKNMIDLCRRIPRLASLVHVSTAYANCDLDTIDEHVYPVETDPERLLETADWLDQDTLQELKTRLLGTKPNTYTYTKSLAEWLLVRTARDLPVVICRPSIVVATASEPFPGWIDNMNGPTGVVLGAGKGLVRSMYAETEFVADLVPADKVINLIVSLGWFAHVNGSQRKIINGNPLDESLSESLFVCSSSGSSAASTSGVDDSLQEDELRSENHHHNHHHHHHHHHHRHEADEDEHNLSERGRTHHQHARLRQNLQKQRQHQDHHHSNDIHLHQQDHSLEDDACSSHEDECTDLSIASESSSSTSGDRQSGQMNEEEGGLYSLQQNQSKQPTSDEHLMMRRRRHDDGYASRSPEYANSIASSDSASSLSSEQGARRARSRDDKKLASARVISISEMKTRTGSQPNELFENAANLVGHDDHQNDHHHHQGHCVTGDDGQRCSAGDRGEFAAKLRRFRARNLAKLDEKDLPEELADIPVFHCTSGGENAITWGQVQLFILAAIVAFPLSGAYRYPCQAFTNNSKLDKFYVLVLHYLPAYLFDLVTRLAGGKPMLVKLFKKFDQAASVLRAFTSKEWKFSYDNRLFLMEELMNDEDKRLFDCDVKSLDWRRFCLDYVIGVRKFLLKEPMGNLAETRRSLNLVYYRNLCLKLIPTAVGAYYAASWVGLLGGAVS